MGLLAVQFAKLARLEVLTLSSPSHSDKPKRMGVDDVFDYVSRPASYKSSPMFAVRSVLNFDPQADAPPRDW